MNVHRAYINQENSRLVKEAREKLKPQSATERFEVVEVSINDPGGNRVYVDRSDLTIRQRLAKALPGVEIRWIRFSEHPQANASAATVKRLGERAIRKALNVADLGKRIHGNEIRFAFIDDAIGTIDVKPQTAWGETEPSPVPNVDLGRQSVDVAPKEEVTFRQSALDHGFKGTAGKLLDYANGYSLEMPFGARSTPTLTITFRLPMLFAALRRLDGSRSKWIFGAVGVVLGFVIGIIV